MKSPFLTVGFDFVSITVSKFAQFKSNLLDSVTSPLIDATPSFNANTSVLAIGVFGSITCPFSTRSSVCNELFILEFPSSSRRTINVSRTTILSSPFSSSSTKPLRCDK